MPRESTVKPPRDTRIPDLGETVVSLRISHAQVSALHEAAENAAKEAADRAGSLAQTMTDLEDMISSLTAGTRDWVAAMDACATADQARDVFNAHENAIAAMQRKLGLTPSCGEISDTHYRGFSTLNGKELASAVTAARRVDKAAGDELERLFDQGKIIHNGVKWDQLLSAEHRKLNAPRVTKAVPKKKPALNKPAAAPKQKPAAKKTKAVAFVTTTPKAVVTSRQTIWQYEASVKSLARQEGLPTWVKKEGPPAVVDAWYAKKTVRQALEDYRASLPPKAESQAAKPAAAKPAKLKEEEPPADAIGESCAAADIGLGAYTSEQFMTAYTSPSDIEAGRIRGILETDDGFDFAVVGMKAAGGGACVYGINLVVADDEWPGPTSTLRENRRGIGPGHSTPLTGIPATWGGCRYVFADEVRNVLFPGMKVAKTSSGTAPAKVGAT